MVHSPKRNILRSKMNWKEGKLVVLKQLHWKLEFANKLFYGQQSEQWSKSDLKPLPKLVDLSNTKKYRSISLTDIAAKIKSKLS